MKSPLLPGLLLLSIHSGLLASVNYPPQKLTFHEDGKLLAETTEPCESTDDQKWNTVTIRFPQPVKFSSQLRITGSIHIEADVLPNHIGFNLANQKDRFGFAKIPVKKNGEIPFSVSFGDFVRAAGKQAEGPIQEGEEIWSIPVYASFSEPVKSKIILHSFRLVRGDSQPAGTANTSKTTPVNPLTTGSFSILPKLHGIHPRLYTSPAEWEAARKNYSANPGAFAPYLPAKDGPEMAEPGHPFDKTVKTQRTAINLAKIAVAYALTGDRRFLDGILRWEPELRAYEPPVMGHVGGAEGLTGGHILLGFSIMYDVLKGRVDPKVESLIRGVLVKQGNRTFRDLAAMKEYPFEQNHLIIPSCGLAVAAMTLVDETPEARQWGVLASNILKKSLQAIAHDGWFFEGFSYWNYTMQFPAAYAAARLRTTGDNLFVNPPFKEAAEYLAQMTLPNAQFVFDFSDWGPRTERDGVSFQKGYDWPWHTLPTRVKTFVPYLIWKEGSHDPFLRDYIRHAAPAGSESSGIYAIDAVFGMLLQIPGGKPPRPMDASYKNHPPYHYFNDMEVVHWRTGWADPDGTAIAFKSGPPAGHHLAALLTGQPDWQPALGHAHPDAGSFILFSKGVFLANDTGYTGKKETADHNSILVDGIGQHKGGTAWETFRGKPYDEYNKIRMENVWLAPPVMASTAVFAAAYADTLGLQAVDRDLILVDGRFMVVRDRIQSSQPHVYEWRLHTDREAEKVSGTRYRMTNGPGRLVIESLNPVAASATAPTIVETNLDTTRSRPQQRGFHLSVQSEKSANHRFLTAFGIQSSSENPAAMHFAKLAPGKVRLEDGQKSCIVWLPGNAELDGAFAYLLKDDAGNVLSAGLRGKSLTSSEISIEMPKDGEVVLRRTKDGWKPDASDLPTGAKVSVQAGKADRQSVTVD